jgi:hypothetical protein
MVTDIISSFKTKRKKKNPPSEAKIDPKALIKSYLSINLVLYCGVKPSTTIFSICLKMNTVRNVM